MPIVFEKKQIIATILGFLYFAFNPILGIFLFNHPEIDITGDSHQGLFLIYILMPVCYFILAIFFGYVYQKIYKIIVVMTILTFLSLFFTLNELGPIPAFFLTPLSIPISLFGCYIGGRLKKEGFKFK